MTLRELGGLLALVAPVLALLAVPGANLGALAVARKGDQAAYRQPPGGAANAPIDVFDVAYAGKNATFAAERGIAPGRRVVLTGLASGARLRRLRPRPLRHHVLRRRCRSLPGEDPGDGEGRGRSLVPGHGRLERPGHGDFRVRGTRLAQIPTPADPYS